MPSRRIISSASMRDIAAVYGEGIRTARTRDTPSASHAIASVSAESMPPDNPIKTAGNAFALRIENARGAVKHQLILSSRAIDIDNRQSRFLGARAQHRHALCLFADVIGRAIQGE